ncbi:MAG: NERD domain-containing protein [Gammaproteobacteria bacterium]|nr:NERD domain-containing protein [Gammaproteobacteria bacterium]MCW8986864.1 NERD domain-containing protein [Gammaproteobacteria bacterium]MCW9029938.1 NERD domain-containing protein [Gammaproteobacteria bacterium]
MSEVFLIVKDFTLINPNLVTWAVTGLFVLMGLALQRVWIKEYISKWKLNRVLRNIGVDSLHNVTIPDEMDGKIFIENLILMPNKILLLGVKKYRGLIFAAEKIDLWTQVIGNKSYKFENPLRQLENDVITLNSKIKNTKVEEKVLFINGAEFPKGKPYNVVEISDISEWQRNNAHSEVSEPLQADWNVLSELVVSEDQNKVKDFYIGGDSATGLNLFSLLSVVIVTTLWIVWRLM